MLVLRSFSLKTFIRGMTPEIVFEVESNRSEEKVVFDIVNGSSSLSKFDSQSLVAFEHISSASSNWIRRDQLSLFRQTPTEGIIELGTCARILLVSCVVWQTIFTDFFSKAFSACSVLLEMFLIRCSFDKLFVAKTRYILVTLP